MFTCFGSLTYIATIVPNLQPINVNLSAVAFENTSQNFRISVLNVRFGIVSDLLPILRDIVEFGKGIDLLGTGIGKHLNVGSFKVGHIPFGLVSVRYSAKTMPNLALFLAFVFLTPMPPRKEFLAVKHEVIGVVPGEDCPVHILDGLGWPIGEVFGPPRHDFKDEVVVGGDDIHNVVECDGVIAVEEELVAHILFCLCFSYLYCKTRAKPARIS